MEIFPNTTQNQYPSQSQQAPSTPISGKENSETWQNLLFGPELEKSYFKQIKFRVQKEREKYPGAIYPSPEDLMSVFKLTPYLKVKVVILGQDPYPTPGHAHGLAFSTKHPLLPASLKIIFKEIMDDVYGGGNEKMFQSGDLTGWAKQGVFLLNTILTVRRNEKLVHENFGWQLFTSQAIELLQKRQGPIVYILWGKHAQSFRNFITNPNHLVLECSHPASEVYKQNSGFFGCRHFSKCNEFLKQHGAEPINWLVTA